MSNKIAQIFLLLCLLIVTSCSTSKNTTATNNMPSLNLQKIENEELLLTLEKIPQNQEQKYGFDKRSEFAIAELGEVFKLYGLANGKLQTKASYRAAVVVNNEYRALLTIAESDGDYHIVNFGASVLAKEIQVVIDKYPQHNFIGILRIYSAKSDFVMLNYSNKYSYIPLTSAKMQLSSKSTQSIKKQYTLEQLKKLLNL